MGDPGVKWAGAIAAGRVWSSAGCAVYFAATALSLAWIWGFGTAPTT
jgi:hypothetical protein